ncbi:Hypothetical predicted protein [Paramuricea clavata]|uniref:Uncharacterized protein n=1 Tax=Paramuricea clavata TaxID=317549 RepID=A0A7D9L1P8_PARCT|nr:Hypothetical predicted protein [Paramuricea clavata]
MPTFNIGDFAKEKKRLLQQIVMKNRGIKGLEDELWKNKTKELSRMKVKCQRLDEKVEKIVKEVEGLQEVKDELDQEAKGSSEHGSNSTEKSRWRIPTYSQDGKISVSAALARKRRKATFEAARKIHGGKDELSAPGPIGLIDTALAKCSKDILVNSMSSSTKFLN